MSDLTITTAGVTESKVSGGEFLSSDKKLNQMKVNYVDVSITLDANAYTVGDTMFIPTKVENAMAVKGGSGILQSATAIIQNNSTEGSATGSDIGSFDIFITSSKVTTNFAAANAAISGGTQTTAVANSICGFTHITNMTDIGRQAVGCVNNIGMVVQADSDTRDLYVFGVANSANDYDSGILVLRLGFVTD